MIELGRVEDRRAENLIARPTPHFLKGWCGVGRAPHHSADATSNTNSQKYDSKLLDTRISAKCACVTGEILPNGIIDR